MVPRTHVSFVTNMVLQQSIISVSQVLDFLIEKGMDWKLNAISVMIKAKYFKKQQKLSVEFETMTQPFLARIINHLCFYKHNCNKLFPLQLNFFPFNWTFFPLTELFSLQQNFTAGTFIPGSWDVIRCLPRVFRLCPWGKALALVIFAVWNCNLLPIVAYI